MKFRKSPSRIKPAKGGFFNVMTKRIALITIAGLILLGSAMAVLPKDPTVLAAGYYEEKINKLQGEISEYNKRAKELSEQADTLSNAISVLQNQQNAIQAEIDLNKAKINELNVQITANELKLKEQGAVLGDTLVDMHLDKRTTPLEILASSKNLSDYVDKAAQQATIKEQVNASIIRIKELKQKLQEEKMTVERLLKDQEARSSQLAMMKQQQQSLLNETQGQEAAYKQLTTKNKEEISRLKAEQARLNQSSTGGGTVVAGDPNHGGYPAYLHNARKDSLIDPWGMYNRECVSYAAWKVHQTYGNMPYWGGIGNANQWDDNARRIGIPNGKTPKARSVIVFDVGRYGHVAWVESVNDNGTINLSEYNQNGDGMYHERYNVNYMKEISIITFIYFGEWGR